MDLLVDVQRIVFAKVLQHHTWDVFLGAVAPLHKEGVALQTSWAGGIRVASQRKLIGIAAEPGVSDLGRTLVRRLRGEGETEEESQYEQQFTFHRTWLLRVQMYYFFKNKKHPLGGCFFI